MAGLDDFENDEAADDATQARAYLDQQAADTPPAAPLPDTQPPPFVPSTQLSPDQETSYQAWKATLPQNLQSEDDYDLRGFYQKNPTFSAADPAQHMTDEFKLPNHKTFSDESRYYNAQTAPYGGHWTREGNNDVFVPNDLSKKQKIVETPDEQDPTAVQPAQGTTPPGPPSLADLGPPPERPKLTGDPTKDNQANLEFGQKLSDYQVALAKKQGEFQAHADSIAKERATREADEERRVVAERQRQQQEFQARQAARQQQIDDAVKEKQAAYTDLKNPEGQSFADKIGDAIAIALGAIGQGYMLKGHVAGAQNEGLNAVNKKIEQDHQRKVERLKAASDAVLEARYGFKDAADNQRAAMNDLDADRAAKYRLIAAEAQQQLQEQGVPPADIKTNALVLNALQEAQKSTDQITAREEQRENERTKAEAENKLAQAHLDLGERQLKATEASRRDTAYEHKREFELKDAEQRARDAERAEAAKDKATVGSVRQNAVLGNLAEAEKATKDIGEVPISSIQKLQTNTEQAKAGEHSATSGVVGNVLTRAARGLGLAARGQYDGIPEEDQKKITAANQVITHLTEMQQGKNLETLEQYNQRYNPYYPGLSVEEVRRREKALPGLVAEQRAIQDPNGVGTKRQEKAKPPEAQKGDAAEAREFLKGPAKPKETPAGKVTRVNMPDGSVQEFDASGKRVK